MALTQKAFALGSQEPPLKKGVLRVYSMRFCPYARRVLLVLAAKNIPHEVVNIHLKSKPDWFLAKTPTGKVPLLEQDGKLLWESMVVADYLDDVGPGPKLWPEDPYERARGKIALDLAGKLGSHIPKLFYGQQSTEVFENALNELDGLDKYLQENKKPYFTGDKLGMADYMIWPLVQVYMAVWEASAHKAKPILCQSSRPAFTAWAEQLLKDPASLKVTPGIDGWAKFAKTVMDGEVNYDVGL